MRFLKQGLAIALVAAVAITIVGCSKSSTTNSDVKVPEGVSAIVNDNNIMTAEVDRRVDQLLSNNPEIMATKNKDQELRKMRENALEQLIGIEITLQEAKKQGLSISDSEYDALLKDLMKKNSIKNEAALEKILKDRKLSYQDFKKDFIERETIKKLADKLTKDVKVSDKEAKDYYNKNKAQFDVSDSVEVQHILDQKIEDANKVIKELKAGADFGELAKKYSIDPGSKDNGGKYPMTPVTNYVPEFSKASMGLEPGKFTEKPVKTNYGYHIIKLLAKEKARKSTFEQAKSKIKEQLIDKKNNDLLNNCLKKARDNSKVVKSLKETTAPAAAPKELPSGTSDALKDSGGSGK
jgi:parvulin-like peptidyl-prolyl isomerase